jgi:hypothetical protein
MLVMSNAGLGFAREGDVVRGADNAGGIGFKPVIDLAQDTTRPKLGNGSVADTTKWPASLYGRYGQSDICTATLLGPRVLLTAAHCVGDGQSATVTRAVGAGGSGRCTRAPQYVTDQTADYALCLMTSDIDASYYETVERDATRVRPGHELIGTGFGCRDLAHTALHPNPQGVLDFLTGVMRIDKVPNSASSQHNFISTLSDPKSAFLCPGDSGGGAFFSDGSEGSDRRTLVAINVQVHKTTLVSDLSSISTPSALSFLATWMHDPANAPTAKICGINLQSPCRDPPP